MFRFLFFLKKIHVVLLFIVLETLALRYYSHSTSYTKAKIVTVSNQLVGGLSTRLSNFHYYFHLGGENRRLLEEVAWLRGELQRYEAARAETPDSLWHAGDDSYKYEFMTAQVVNGSASRQENYLTLNKGSMDGVVADMAIIANGGIIGYVIATSDHFAVGISLLNVNFKTSGRIKNSDYLGSIGWDGKYYDEVVFTELPKYAEFQKGDTVLTTNYSTIFPPDLYIGTVQDSELINGTYYEVRVKIRPDIMCLSNVILVRYVDIVEQQELEKSVLQLN